MQSRPSNTIAIRLGALLAGALFTAMGVLVVLTVLGYLPSAKDFAWSARVMAMLGAATFVFAVLGMLLFGAGANRLAPLAAGLALLCFLLTFNWIAFGPGERDFTRKTQSSFSATTVSQVSETEGRLVFGVITGLVDLLIVYGFVSARRRRNR